ncbi:hypothetical protein PF005_g26103 [Phytophthora fragariae]|uniref:START domain-containing protein n=1 Tax=Phytophthora fragariae TaxID=53985 RepID=A0A6A3DWW1_9STRA|nr:hypothetical protein PF003_g29648 [Phytophthora fragariae]KAE8924417.1 hypothetical protein PF009_g25351 [Phytophthora fragariae]KAE9072622.1 hypothetical protein PF007_g26108 [Phytophthora fragariae]KAE9173848.1 hypothetical protein PF005_g26103 [Phytophthora fragariae]
MPPARLELTDVEEQDCYDRASRLLDRTLRGYDDRDEKDRSSAPAHHSKLDSSRWKLLKTQTDASLYVERDSSAHRDYSSLGVDWEEDPVVILTAGTIRGELDEVMLGLKALDANSIRSRTEMLTNHIADSAVLAELLGPTEVDPFRFLGVTWLMYEQSWPLKSVLRPRDLLSLTSTGTMTRANGEHFGYEVVQPIEFSQCPPWTADRGNVMYAALFKQQEPGVVDVYVSTYVETQGAFLDKVVVGFTWKAMLRFWDAPQLAEMKKLQWCITIRGLERQKDQGQTSLSSGSACKRCFEGPSMMNRDSPLLPTWTRARGPAYCVHHLYARTAAWSEHSRKLTKAAGD